MTRAASRLYRLAGFNAEQERETLDELKELRYELTSPSREDQTQAKSRMKELRAELWEKYAPEQWHNGQCPYRMLMTNNIQPWPENLTTSRLVWVLENLPLMLQAESLLLEAEVRCQGWTKLLDMTRPLPLQTIYLAPGVIDRVRREKTREWPFVLLNRVVGRAGLRDFKFSTNTPLIQGPATKKLRRMLESIEAPIRREEVQSWAAARMLFDTAIEMLQVMKAEMRNLTFNESAQRVEDWLERTNSFPKNPFEPFADLEDKGFELYGWHPELGPQITFIQASLPDPFPSVRD